MSVRPTAADRRGRWARFVQRYGWRAYALPLLSAITLAALVHGTPSTTSARNISSAAGHSSAASPTSTSSPSRSKDNALDPAGGGVQAKDLAPGSAGSALAPEVVNLGDDGVSCAENTYSHLVLVSISRQHLWACDGHKQVTDTAVTTGAVVHSDQTPLGSWRVQAKQRDRYLVGPGYKDYVHYWVPFNGDFGLHDAPWQSMPYGSKNWPTQGSHGCVHVPETTMAWIYRWADVGSTVVTVES